MQRLHRKSHPTGSSVLGEPSHRLAHVVSGSTKRSVRGGAADQDQAGCSQLRSLIDGAPVVVHPIATCGLVGSAEPASAAQAGHSQAGTSDGPDRGPEAHFRNPIPPGSDPAQAGSSASLRGLGQRPRRNRCLVQAEAAQPSRGHRQAASADSRRTRIPPAARSGSAGNLALSRAMKTMSG